MKVNCVKCAVVLLAVFVGHQRLPGAPRDGVDYSRAKTLNELADDSLFYVKNRPINMDEKASKLLAEDARLLLAKLTACLTVIEPWSSDTIDAAIRSFAETEGVKLGQIAQPLRAALCGTNKSPGIFEVADILGKEEVLGRLDDVISA